MVISVTVSRQAYILKTWVRLPYDQFIGLSSSRQGRVGFELTNTGANPVSPIYASFVNGLRYSAVYRVERVRVPYGAFKTLHGVMVAQMAVTHLV